MVALLAARQFLPWQFGATLAPLKTGVVVLQSMYPALQAVASLPVGGAQERSQLARRWWCRLLGCRVERGLHITDGVLDTSCRTVKPRC